MIGVMSLSCVCGISAVSGVSGVSNVSGVSAVSAGNQYISAAFAGNDTQPNVKAEARNHDIIFFIFFICFDPFALIY